MKTIGRILLRDLKALGHNPVALFVVLALVVLPGLYAWYCIVANWDPYSNTERMPIAIVNEDKGATSDMTGDINLGKQVVDKLADNDTIDWRFYDNKEDALEATRTLECYATFVFPEDLSESVVGIFNGSDEVPTLYYYPNEKKNAVATKVTDSAANTLIVQINQEFSSTVNETLIREMQKGVDKAEASTDQARDSAVKEINGIRSDLKKTIAQLDSASASIVNWRDSVASIQQALIETAEQLPGIRASLDESSSDLDALRLETIKFDSTFSQTLAQANLALANLSLRASTDVGNATADVSEANAGIDGVIEYIKAIVETHGGIEPIKDLLIQVLDKLEAVSDQLDNSVADANQTVQDMNSNVQEVIDATNTASKEFSQEALPQLSAGTYELVKALSGLSSAIAQFEPQIAELQGVLGNTDSALVEADDAIAQAKTLLANVDNDLGATVSDLGALSNALELDKISTLLNIDPDNVGTFMSTPANLVTEKIFPVSNYGTAVAPFYTCLALWIGCFILLSVIKLEVDSEGFEEATTAQRYFGRLALLMLLALIQSQVICGVDILLGIDCANPVAFLAAGAVCSFVFMNLLYALVITFRNIGKTLCIVLLIMQIPGSSGMYPIEMMPDFYQAIHPMLPFTYGIDAMREALCGMYGADYFVDLLVLLVLVVVALIIGLVIRPRSLNVTQLFDEELNKAGFFESEQHGTGGQHARFVGVVRALAGNNSYRDDIEQRARAFRRRYPVVRRVGSIALLVIPFVFLVIMLPLNVFLGIGTDAKLEAFAFVLIALLAIQAGLILLEYANRIIAAETEMLGLDAMGPAHTVGNVPYTTFADKADDVRLALEEELPLTMKLPSGVARDIFFTDMRLGFQSVIGVVVIALLVITPSLYAWFNILGCWNPYSNTGNLKVAVANNDVGYKGDLMPMRIDIGDTIVAQLRSEAGFDWVFVSEDEAVQGVYDETYYAAIVIPDDFSRNMMTYLIEDAEYPDIVYYTNEKENPIAPIITQKGANSIQEGIRTSFTERVDEIGLSIASDLADYLTSPNLSSYATKVNAHLDNVIRDIRDGASAMRTLASLSSTASNVVSTAGVAMQGISASSSIAKNALDTAEGGADNAAQAFDTAATIIEQALAGSSGNLDRIAADIDATLVDLETNTADAPAALHESAAMLTEAAEGMDVVATAAEEAAELEPDPVKKQEMLEEAARLRGIANSTATLADAVTNAANHSDSLGSDIEATRAELKELVADADASIAETRSYYQNNIKAISDDIRAAMKSTSAAVHAIMDDIEAAIGGLSGNSDSLEQQLNELSEGLTETSERLDRSAQKMADTKKRLTDALTSGDVKQIEDVVLGADTTKIAERMAAPLVESREPLYAVENFGSAMAPFYTVLSLWVGALVLVATLQLHVAEERMERIRRRYAKVRAFHEYAGRYGIFALIELLQSLLVLLGDLCLLHIQCVNPLAFVVFGVFIGQVFCLFVYTLSELFGDFGKALCVILLIMQVAASGGTFPVEMLDPMLSNLVPFFPFYHGMNLLKECVAGIYWPAVGGNIGFLVAMAAGVLVVGIALRKPLRKFDDWFEGQLRKTGYM